MLLYRVRFDDERLVGREILLAFAETPDGRPDGRVHRGTVVSAGLRHVAWEEPPLLLVRFDEPIQFEVTGSYRGPFESLALARRYDFTWWAAHELWTVGVNAYDPATLHSGAAPLHVAGARVRVGRRHTG